MYRLLQVNEKQKKPTTTSINKKDNKCINKLKKGKNIKKEKTHKEYQKFSLL